jgi:hypothetical protein
LNSLYSFSLHGKSVSILGGNPANAIELVRENSQYVKNPRILFFSVYCCQRRCTGTGSQIMKPPSLNKIKIRGDTWMDSHLQSRSGENGRGRGRRSIPEGRARGGTFISRGEQAEGGQEER